MSDIPEFLVRKVERAIADATNPKGMGLHDGMARIEASLLARLLKVAQLAAPDLRATFRDTMDSLDLAELAVQQTVRIAELEKQLAAAQPVQAEREPVASDTGPRGIGYCELGHQCMCGGDKYVRMTCPSWIRA